VNSKTGIFMSKRFLASSQEAFLNHNIYADKSALVLEWLLLEGLTRCFFSIREVSRAINVSLGLVQRVFKVLIINGLITSSGVATEKKFAVKKAPALLESWLEHYSIIKKCKIWTYSSGLQGQEGILEALAHSGFSRNVAFALHSAADAHRCKNSNLKTVELYLLQPAIRLQIEQLLFLEPQERGYEVLLIEPYYKNLLNHTVEKASSPLLTYLDLYHFPLRGREQAEFMAQRIPELKQIYKGRAK